VLPNHDVISLPVLKKLKELVAAGATVLGPQPVKAETLQDYPAGDTEIAKLADEIWSSTGRREPALISNGNLSGLTSAATNDCGTGRVIAGKTAREVLLAGGVPPDCEFRSTGNPQAPTDFDYIHRTADGAEIYFVANRLAHPASANCLFRVAGKAPELWNPVSGERKFAAVYGETSGRTVVPLDFDPCGSWFVVFREPASAHPATAKSNSPMLEPLQEIFGPWTVHFDPKWGGPASVQFDSLVDWTTRAEPGIKFYSGTAIYEQTFSIPGSALRTPHSALWLDLGDVHELAEVKVNGQSCGIVWTPPFRADITNAVKPGENKLEVAIVNFWPNRIIGDASLPPNQRFTQTNIRNLKANTPLMESGLLGPVRILSQQ